MTRVLITGGAGFIGSHLLRALASEGYRVRVLDCLVEQAHRGHGRAPVQGIEILHGDVCDRDAVARALKGVEVVFHLAAEVGVGQSMYAMHRYAQANSVGTTILLEEIVRRRKAIRKVIVASSMSIYGEGAYDCGQCGPVAPPPRSAHHLATRHWEVHCPHCGEVVEPQPTPESKPLDPQSVYAITKQDQEQLCLSVGRAYRIPTVALRYFNVYGPGQALSNPYTGVMAIFSGRLLDHRQPVVFEDGLQTRDFTHVSDIVQANVLAMKADAANDRAINVGTGVATPVVQVAELIAAGLDVPLRPRIEQRYRAGDIRHCIADIALAKELLGYTPGITMDQGIPELLAWVRTQQASNDVEQATRELETYGLVT